MSRLLARRLLAIQSRCPTIRFQSQKHCLDTKQENGVRTIKLNHAKSRNSLSLEMLQQLLRQVTLNTGDLRSIVITAEPGKVFSAGHNLKELTTENGADQHKSVFLTCADLMEAIRSSEVPVIAAVDGLAAAAGCQLVAACDIAVCTERSSFSTPGVNFGIFCSTPSVPLVRSVPIKVASHMLYTGLPITAREACEAGLVSKVVPNDKLGEEVDKITSAINSKSRAVVQLGKEFLERQKSLNLADAYKRGTEVMLDNLKFRDCQEGIKSFAEKRKPVWSHRDHKINFN